MTTSHPDPVEKWAPVFLFYTGTHAPKFTDEQVLKPEFAISFGFCKLCDAPVTGDPHEHMERHRSELKVWRKHRSEEAAKNAQAGLAAARAEKRLAKEMEISDDD